VGQIWKPIDSGVLGDAKSRQWTRLSRHSTESKLARVEACTGIRHALNLWSIIKLGNPRMVWTTPTLEEICIDLEINGYLPAEF
jgi:hypothetical protein